MRARIILVVGLAAVLGFGAYFSWSRSLERHFTEATSATTFTEATTTTTVAVTSATTATVATPVTVETVTTTTELVTATTQPAEEPQPVEVPDVEVEVPDSPAPTTTTTLPAEPEVTVTVGPQPDFGAIKPTHFWPDEPTTAVSGQARQSVSVWERIEAFWEWYMSEGHAQGLEFDAATRQELSPVAAEQVNWVHRRFWAEVVPTWERVWNEEFAKEREQQREWLMIIHGLRLMYNHPDDGIDARYWGPAEAIPIPGQIVEEGDPVSVEGVLLPLMDLEAVKAWMADRGRDLDAFTREFDVTWSFDADFLADAHGATYADESSGWHDGPVDLSPISTDDPLWQEWARSVDLEAILGPQAAGGKLGPAEGEMWYQWHPEGFDVSSLFGYPDPIYGTSPDSIFDAFPDWWPDRLEVPIHDPAWYGVGGTIAPQNPDTGNFYFEVCLWATGGLFGPWSLPHPDLLAYDASANTTWWVTGIADPAGTILEISLPRNRPCLYKPDRVLHEWHWENEWDLEVETAMGLSRGLYTVEGQDDPEAVKASERWYGYQQARVDMWGRNDLGSWLWREHPNPDSPDHSWFGWAPAHDYNKAPETLGVMIHPLYLWHPDGKPAGYPAGNADTPWKWWPIAPAYQYPDEHGALFHVSIGGCHRPNEPYLWTNSLNVGNGITTDGGPVWAWPGVVQDAGILPFLRDLSDQRWWDRGQESGNWYETPRTVMQHGVAFGSYHPPVPCQDILDGKYEPDQVALKVDISTYEGWMPSVGDQPHPEWTNPDNPFTR